MGVHTRSNMSVSDAARERAVKKPDAIPSTVYQFRRMTLSERQWLYENRPEIYNEMTRKERGEL